MKVMADKRQAATIEQRDLEPKLEIIRTKTRELQEQVRQQSFYFQWNLLLLCRRASEARSLLSIWKLKSVYVLSFDNLTFQAVA